MKKYLSLAALLGLIAFISVSYLAQAQNGLGLQIQEETVLPQNGDETGVSDALARFMQNAEACEARLAAEPGSEYITQQEYDASFTACMVDRGHSAEEVKTRYLDNQPVAPSVE